MIKSHDGKTTYTLDFSAGWIYQNEFYTDRPEGCKVYEMYKKGKVCLEYCLSGANVNGECM